MCTVSILSIISVNVILGSFTLLISSPTYIVTGKLFPSHDRVDIVVRMEESAVSNLEKLYQIPMRLPDGSSVLLSDLIELKTIQGPNQISRENGKRLIVITANVRGTDMGSYIADVVAEIERVSKGVYGNNYEFTQPIQMRFNELISGVRTDVAVKISGDDLEQLLELGNEVADILETVNGTADLKVEQMSGLQMVSIDLI